MPWSDGCLALTSQPNLDTVLRSVSSRGVSNATGSDLGYRLDKRSRSRSAFSTVRQPRMTR